MSETVMATALATALRRAPVVMLLGAEGSGKTALAASQSARDSTFLSGRDPEVMERLRDHATAYNALEPLRGLVVIDDVDAMPHLGAALRPLVDRDPGWKPRTATFLLTARPCAGADTIAGALVGRVEVVEVEGAVRTVTSHGVGDAPGSGLD